MDIDAMITQIAKPATIFEVGGFRPDANPASSWVGKVMLGKAGEKWPDSNGRPMIPICQLNLTNIPFKPATLSDIEFLTLFIDQEEIPSDDNPNGDKWCLRTYSKLEELAPIHPPKYQSYIKPFQLRPKLEAEDFPCWEDCPVDLTEEVEDEYENLFPNVSGLKIGGWPTLVQNEIYWAPLNQHTAKPAFVLQIDSDDKAHMMWGDSGILYFGRGTTPGYENKWYMSRQCY